MPFEQGAASEVDYNQMYLANQTKELRKGLEIYIYTKVRKEELDRLIKAEGLKVNKKTTYDEAGRADYWTYNRIFYEHK